MMMQEVKYKSYYEIDNEKPHIELGFKFNDYFEKNTYYLISESDKFKNIDNLIFEILKDEKKIGEIELKNQNIETFLENFSNLTKDHDFKKIILSKHKIEIEKEMTNFFENYKKTILENKFTFEGEIKRMRSIAGII